MTPLYKQNRDGHRPRALDPNQPNVLLGAQGIVILAPHPDDEVLGCGAFMAASVAQGIPVRVIYLTDGGASQPGLTEEERTQLVVQRQHEALAGLAVLGVPSTNALFVGAPDGLLHSSKAYEHLAIFKLHELIMQGSVSAVFVTSPSDGHIDHQSAYALAVKALRQYPTIPLYTYPVSSRIDHGSITRVHFGFDIRVRNESFEGIKRAALDCHVSQLQQLSVSNGFTIAREIVDAMCEGPEYFQAVDMKNGH